MANVGQLLDMSLLDSNDDSMTSLPLLARRVNLGGGGGGGSSLGLGIGTAPAEAGVLRNVTPVEHEEAGLAVPVV